MAKEHVQIEIQQRNKNLSIHNYYLKVNEFKPRQKTKF